jgi:cytochrome c peroxidase
MLKSMVGWFVRVRIARVAALQWTLVVACLLGGCGGGGGGSGDPAPAALDTKLRALAVTTLALTGDPAAPRGVAPIRPDDDPLVKLGQLLFYSQTLSSGYDVSCGTCHHTDFGGSDGLSLSVGVVPKNPATIGPGREIDQVRDLDPGADGGPNMRRNSITTFNAALFDRGLMFDGRVFVLDAATASGGHGQHIRTPESGLVADTNPLDGLLEFAVKGPIANDNWMRGFLYSDLATPTTFREHIVQRLQGTVDTQYNPRADAAANWLARFRAAFKQPAGTAEQLVTRINVQRALAAYIGSQIFVDTPWRRYLAGDDAAIPTTAKEGALLFMAARENGGLGCNTCHAGNRFTDEAFHNLAFPQIGRGSGRAERDDMGRWLVTRAVGDEQAFRTPSLLNVAKTAPYGHAGTFQTIADLLAYHADPRRAVDEYDFSLVHLTQFSGGTLYPEAERHTRDALLWPNFATAEAQLPRRPLTSMEIQQLSAFLATLTDSCVATPACIGKWAPTLADDPDGHTLIRNQPLGTPAYVDAQRPSGYPLQFPLAYPALSARPTFADVQDCTNNIGNANNTGQDQFVLRSEPGFGLGARHGYSFDTWFGPQQTTPEVALMSGGVSATYLDEDCWPDLVFTGGAVSGMVFHHNNAGAGFSALDLLTGDVEREYSGSAIADLNGDYRRELVLGNVNPGTVPIYSPNGTGKYDKVAALPMIRPTFGISFAPLDRTGKLNMYLAHWAGSGGTDGSSPALWRFSGPTLYPWDKIGGTTSASVDQLFNFTPNFADFDDDGRIDLVIASDFRTSSVLRNVPNMGGWHFENQTRQSPITDENGMGTTLLDIDNDGNLEWFVTAILDESNHPAGNWGVTGNRLYRNASTPGNIRFTDVTDKAHLRHGHWGWGACAADFNNDGFIDLFQANGFGRIPDDVATTPDALATKMNYDELSAVLFQDKPSRLFINNGDGTFTDAAVAWGAGAPSEGRGVTCLDYDRDGDVDVAVFDHSRSLQFFENRGGSGAGRRFLGVRLVGAPPNTDAIGARVYVTADVGRGHGMQTQMRLSKANSNFNSQDLPDLYFGLGDATVASELRVRWPGGTELTCTGVMANQFVVIDQRDAAGACPAAPP